MTLEALRKLVAAGEGETLEFKATTGQRESACETLCGYLNKDGGTVVFGVTRKGELTGQLVSDKTKRELFEVFAKFEPSADIGVDWVDVDATHQAIVCTVPRGNERPYVYDGRPYKRVQSSTTVMKREEYNRMLQERRGFESPWESMPNPKLTLDHIDLEEVRRTARKAVHMGRLDPSVDTEDAVGLLDRFQLRENGVLLNGAAVLFGNNKSVWYPQLEVKMGWFRGTTDREFLDNRHVSGNVFKLMDEAMAFCFKHLNLSAKIGGKLERDESLEVPAAALREALVNAFAHRDYDDTRTVYLAVYADRVEIKSPGGFPTTLDLEHLYNPPVCDSRPRNPRIARVLYLCKMIETWGRGLGVIAGECKRAGLALPATVMRWGYVVTTFKRPMIDGSGSNLDQNLDHADPDPIQIDPDIGGDIPRRLLSTLRRNPLISRKLLAVELNVSERRIRDSLNILKDSGVILRQGPDHGGIWRISHIVTKTKRHDTINIPQNEAVNEPVNGLGEPVNGTINQGREGIKEVYEGINEGINEGIKLVLELLNRNSGINAPQIAALLGKGLSTVERTISEGIKMGVIEHRGSKKTGGYYAVK